LLSNVNGIFPAAKYSKNLLFVCNKVNFYPFIANSTAIF